MSSKYAFPGLAVLLVAAVATSRWAIPRDAPGPVRIPLTAFEMRWVCGGQDEDLCIGDGGSCTRGCFGDELDPVDIDFSGEVVLVPEELARQLEEAAPSVEAPVPAPTAPPEAPGGAAPPTGEAAPLFTGEKVAAIRWRGRVPPQKWTTFYTKVLSRLVSDGGLELEVEFEAKPPGGLYAERADEIGQHLRELGLADDIEVDEVSE